MEQGEIWWARLAGDAGTRPALLLTRSRVIPHLSHVTIAQISRTIRNIPTHVKLTREADGMQSDCAVNLDNIQTIPKSLLIQKMVRLRHERLEEVFAAIRSAFDMPC